MSVFCKSNGDVDFVTDVVCGLVVIDVKLLFCFSGNLVDKLKVFSSLVDDEVSFNSAAFDSLWVSVGNDASFLSPISKLVDGLVVVCLVIILVSTGFNLVVEVLLEFGIP